MAGQSTNLLWTYLTPRRIYRHEVAVADTAPGGDLPVIVADAKNTPPSVAPAAKSQGSGFGSNTVLALAVVRAGGTSATINVYMRANAEGVGYAGTPAVYATTAPWVLVHSQVVTVDVLIMLRDYPAAEYCVTVTDIVGEATVTILEQHTE